VFLDECHDYSSDESVHDAVMNDAGALTWPLLFAGHFCCCSDVAVP